MFSDNGCTCKLYADDLKLYTELLTDADYAVLQSKLNDICAWSIRWQLEISYKKCNVLYIGKHDSNIIMQLNGNSLPVLNSFHSHINKMVSRAFIRSNLIYKCFVSRDVHTLIRAFTVYVRPLVEYASCVWSPHQAGLIKKAESVQRKFTKRLPGFKNLSYKTRLARLQLDSLELRRLRQDIVYTYKILFGLTGDTASDFFTRVANNINNNHHTRGHEYKLFPAYSRVDTRKFFLHNG